MNNQDEVRVWFEDVKIPTFLPALPDKNPMFLEKRVYQGSSGKVYPLPFTDRIADKKIDRLWKGIWLENEYIRVLILPEIGGRIHVAQDKTNHYDFVYRQTVIKPALVGLAGPWISGGIEFNWPQHHRPATFLPVDVQVENHPDGSITVWCSDHDPMARMKGMHGVCLHPGKSYIELKVRAYNRTSFVQTFLWWANVATRVHEGYQSFFPPDVYYVADHAKRATSRYPLCDGHYYGVPYGQRGKHGVPENEMPSMFQPPHCQQVSSYKKTCCGGEGNAPSSQRASHSSYVPNDLSWYANIPVPTSYMCMGSQQDFFGGYDHIKEAGIVHIANHHISPGKKQWTWGNHDFGYAWDRNLTETDGPYIELMAGVYTDNQPDFSFLQPGETKTWSQYWYPIQKIGPAQYANLQAALSLRVLNREKSRTVILIGVAVSSRFPQATIDLMAGKKKLMSITRDLSPDAPLVEERKVSHTIQETDLNLKVRDACGREIASYQPMPQTPNDVPPPATEPPPPEKVSSADELFITGLHLEQYRHATRSPIPYWQEALRRDPGDTRCHNALGRWHFRRGEFDLAESHYRQAINRWISRNPNPYDGEVYYNLGLCLRAQADAIGLRNKSAATTKYQEAYAAFYKATWNQAWQAPSYHGLAELDALNGNWDSALNHLDLALRRNIDNLRARNLKVMVLCQLDRCVEAQAFLRETLTLDPLDWWARFLDQQPLSADLQTCLDIAHDLARAGFLGPALELLGKAAACPCDLPDQSWGTLPLIQYTVGWFHERLGETAQAMQYYCKAAKTSPDYCFPARLEEIAILSSAMLANPKDARAAYYLGNLLYDRQRYVEAIQLWERSVKLDPNFSIPWRNLGIGYYNIQNDSMRSLRAYDRAFKANPGDARLLFERDQLWKRVGESPARRLRALEKYLDLVKQRDDLTIELCALYNQTRQHQKARTLISNRHFQPWEGGEGQASGQYVRTQLALGRTALNQGRAAEACEQFEAAMTIPRNLGEAWHLLANRSEVFYWAGVAREQLGDMKKAREHWLAAANFQGDFQDMSVCTYSEMTYFTAMACDGLGEKRKGQQLLHELLAYAKKLHHTPAVIDYFATSLPAMLLFADNLQTRQETNALFMQAQAELGLGRKAKARNLLEQVLQRDPNHAMAADTMEHFANPT